MLSAIISLTVLGTVLGSLLMLASRYLTVEGDPLEGEIEGMLPGTQCGQCGYPGCGPAAQAMVRGEAPVTICPPGGRTLASTLSEKLGVEADLSNMEEGPSMLAFINEDLCVGCTKCLKRCPTDAIVGASKQIHVVIGAACTACEKCVDICPTECITLRPESETPQTWHWPKPDLQAPLKRPTAAEAA